jgi:RNA polymerase sigma-70 factor, ECF subfamily
VVYRWITRHGLQAHDAADVAQDVFRAVAENITRFAYDSPGDSMRGWLWRITRNKVHDHFRHRQKDFAAAGGTDALQQMQQIADMPQALDESPDELTAELSHRALTLIQNEFEASTWRAFWRTAVDGQLPAATAAELGLTPAAVYKAKSRVLLRLRRELTGLL